MLNIQLYIILQEMTNLLSTHSFCQRILINYSKVSFGEVYRRIYGRKFRFTAPRNRRIYGRKFSFTATRKRSRKRDFRTYIRRYTSPNENFEYGYPHSNALLTFSLQKDSEMYFVAPIHPAAASCINPLASCIYSLVNQ